MIAYINIKDNKRYEGRIAHKTEQHIVGGKERKSYNKPGKKAQGSAKKAA